MFLQEFLSIFFYYDEIVILILYFNTRFWEKNILNNSQIQDISIELENYRKRSSKKYGKNKNKSTYFP